MKTKDALLNLKNNNIDDETREFLIQKLQAKTIIRDDIHCSTRCPRCNIALTSSFYKYCYNCGQRLKRGMTIYEM